MKNFKRWALPLLGVLLLIVMAGCTSSLSDAKDALQKGDKEKALNIAIDNLSSGNEDTRIEAANLIGEIGGERGGMALVPLFRDKEPRVVAAALKAVGKTGSAGAGAGLADLVANAQSETFDLIAAAFRGIGPGAIDHLVTAYDQAGNKKAFRAMLLQVGPTVAPSLAKSLAGKSALENEEKFAIMVELKSPKVGELLVGQIDDPEVGEMVAEGLVKLGGLAVDAAIAGLTERADSPEKAKGKELLCRALGDIKSKRAIPALEKAAKDQDDLVRAAADRALTKVRGF